MLFDAAGHPFTSGALHYLDHHPRDGIATSRIVIKVGVGVIETEAIVDTGGLFFICDAGILALGECELGAALEKHRLNVRGYVFEGNLYRTSITLLAQVGENVPFEATTFVPRGYWPFPSFLGLQGCLEFIRFAVDPETNTFYFGAITD